MPPTCCLISAEASTRSPIRLVYHFPIPCPVCESIQYAAARRKERHDHVTGDTIAWRHFRFSPDPLHVMTAHCDTLPPGCIGLDLRMV